MIDPEERIQQTMSFVSRHSEPCVQEREQRHRAVPGHVDQTDLHAGKPVGNVQEPELQTSYRFRAVHEPHLDAGHFLCRIIDPAALQAPDNAGTVQQAELERCHLPAALVPQEIERRDLHRVAVPPIGHSRDLYTRDFRTHQDVREPRDLDAADAAYGCRGERREVQQEVRLYAVNIIRRADQSEVQPGDMAVRADRQVQAQPADVIIRVYQRLVPG